MVARVADAAVDVRQACADAVLVALQRVEVDGVGEVRGKEFVGLGFETTPVNGQLGEFVGVTRASLQRSHRQWTERVGYQPT